MKKTLLSVALIVAASAANAQLLNYGFEADQTTPGEIQTVNWQNYETSVFSFTGADSYEGQYSLNVSTQETANRWERVVAFKDIPLETEKSYRVTYFVKGTTPLDLAIMQGDFDMDMPLLAGNGESYTQQVYNLKAERDGWQRISQVFWSPSFETQAQFFPQFKADTELLQKYFLRFSFTGAGELSVDNITVEESSIAGVIYNGDAIRVDFGYATNGKEIAAAAGGTAEFTPECVKVVANGEEVEVESVEIKADGNLYIFLTEASWLTSEDQVAVSFNNTLGLTYSTTTAPESWTSPNCAVYNFENEAAYCDEEFAASSVAYEEAELVSSDPADESFELDYNITTFSFTYNKNVLTSFDGDKAKAVIEGGKFSEELVLVESEEANPTITFNRASSEPLAKGIYTITVENVYNEKGVVKGTPDMITIEVGKVSVAETTYEKIIDGTFPGCNGNYPLGWTMYMDKGVDETTGEPNVEIRTHTEEGGFGQSRGFDLTNSTVAGAIYMRYLDWSVGEGNPSVTYGNMEGYELTIPAGDVEVRVISAGWDGSGGNMLAQIFKETLDGQEVASKEISVATGNNSRDNREFQKDAFRFTSEGGNYVFKYGFASGYGAVLFGGFEIYTYTETEGEKSESEVLLAETWASTNNNAAPVYGSGWRIYASGTPKNPGQDYNYSGARIFDLGYKNLNKGFYNGMAGNASTDYIIYGEGQTYTDEEGNELQEPTFKLQSGKVQITYYCTNWKTNLQHQTFDIINKETGEVVYTRTDDITPNPGGDRNANIEAQKVQFTYYIPETAEYMLKYYTDGEGFVGNIKIETVGSLAVQYKNLLKEALVAAQEELNTALENDNYAGTTRDALAQAIQDYTDPDFHTVAEYNNAIAHLEQLQKAMAARRSNINEYASALETVIAAVENCTGSKYEGLDCYVAAAALVESYANVQAKDLEDEELAACVAEIKLNGKLLNNMVNEIVPDLLTKQLANIAAQIVALDENQLENDAILAAGNAISDDQVLAKGLKLYLAGTIYKQLGEGKDLFSVYDAEYDITTPDSLELALIQNPMFYTTIIADGTNYEGKADSYPGWDIDIQACNVMGEFGWVGNDGSKFSDIHPYTNAIIATTWGDCDIKVSQELAQLPVGQYTIILATMDRSYVDKNEEGSWVAINGETTSCTFVQQPGAEERQEQIFNIANIGQYYGQSDTYMMNVPATSGEDLTGSFTYGAHMTTHGGTFASIDNARIYMTGKADGFNYAEAATKVLAEAAEGIEVVERNDEPAASFFFDLNGRQISAAQGVCVRIDRYADGYTVVRKVVVK